MTRFSGLRMDLWRSRPSWSVRKPSLDNPEKNLNVDFFHCRWKFGFKTDGWSGNAAKKRNKKPKAAKKPAVRTRIKHKHQRQSRTIPASANKRLRKIRATRGKFKRANLSIDLTWCNAITVKLLHTNVLWGGWCAIDDGNRSIVRLSVFLY